MVAKNFPSLFSNKCLNTNKKCTVWKFLCSKIVLLPLQIPENIRKCTCTSEVLLLIFFHKLLFGDIKLSDLERRNRKLSAHDCTDHIKTRFSSDIYNYHETWNILKHKSSRHVACTRPQLWKCGYSIITHT